MKPFAKPESDDAAMRRTARALGEIPPGDPTGPDSPGEAADAEATRQMADALRVALRREPVPFVNPAVIAARAMGESAPAASAAPASSRRRSGLGGAMSREERSGSSPWIWAGAAAAACVAVTLISVSRDTPAATSAGMVASAPGSTPDGAFTMSPAGFKPGVGALLAAMPGLPGAGEAFHPAGRAALALSAPRAREYADALRREFQAGRSVADSRLRVDALANAFVSGRAGVLPGGRTVAVETVLTEAPWDASRRLLRVTVRGCGRSGETVAAQVVAALDFSPEAVKGWRLVGHTGAVAPATAVSLRGGDAVTTLFEIEPAAGAKPEWLARVSLKYLAGARRETVGATVVATDFKSLADADADTRFVAGLADFAKDRAKANRLLALAGEDAERVAFAKAAAAAH